MKRSFVAGRAERGTCPPLLTAFIATPKFGGFPRAPTPRWRFASWRSEISSELHEGTQSEPECRNHREGAPQQTQCCLGGSDERSEERGACYALCSTCNEAPLREPSTSNRSASSPLFAKMGGRKRADSPSPRHGGSKITPCFKKAGAFWGGMLRALLNLSRPSLRQSKGAFLDPFFMGTYHLSSSRSRVALCPDLHQP
jgi:hypothetical protein